MGAVDGSYDGSTVKVANIPFGFDKENGKDYLLSILRYGQYANDMSEDIELLRIALGIPKKEIREVNGVLYYFVDDVRAAAGLVRLDGVFYYARISEDNPGVIVAGQKYWISEKQLNGYRLKATVYVFDEHGVMQVYKVRNYLTNVISDNTDMYLTTNGADYVANLTAAEGYTISSVTVTMGGVDITATAYADGVITIPSVTGAIVITAAAEVSA